MGRGGGCDKEERQASGQISLFQAFEEYIQAILRTIRRRMKSLMDVTDKYRYHCYISSIVLNHCLLILYQCRQYIHWVGPVGWSQQESWRWWTRTGNVKKYQVAWFRHGVPPWLWTVRGSCKLELVLFLAISRGALLACRMLTPGMGDKKNRGILITSQF